MSLLTTTLNPIFITQPSSTLLDLSSPKTPRPLSAEDSSNGPPVRHRSPLPPPLLTPVLPPKGGVTARRERRNCPFYAVPCCLRGRPLRRPRRARRPHLHSLASSPASRGYSRAALPSEGGGSDQRFGQKATQRSYLHSPTEPRTRRKSDSNLMLLLLPSFPRHDFLTGYLEMAGLGALLPFPPFSSQKITRLTSPNSIGEETSLFLFPNSVFGSSRRSNEGVEEWTPVRPVVPSFLLLSSIDPLPRQMPIYPPVALRSPSRPTAIRLRLLIWITVFLTLGLAYDSYSRGEPPSTGRLATLGEQAKDVVEFGLASLEAVALLSTTKKASAGETESTKMGFPKVNFLVPTSIGAFLPLPCFPYFSAPPLSMEFHDSN
jgi:hypothetical protein